MAGYGFKQVIQDARIAKGHKQEENSCGDCGAPVRGTQMLCRDCTPEVIGRHQSLTPFSTDVIYLDYPPKQSPRG